MKKLITTLGLLFCVNAFAANPPIIWGSPYAKLLTKGIQTSGSDTTTTCVAGLAGSIRYNAGTFEGCDGSTWSAMNGGASGVTTMAAVGSSPSANGASISGATLTLQPASATLPGVLSSTTQSILGAKSFLTSVASPIFKSGAANPASAGVIRLINGSENIEWRNAANNGDISLWVDSTNIFQLNSNVFVDAGNATPSLTASNSATGISDSVVSRNTVTAANNSGGRILFTANRTGTADTSIAGVAGIITDITAGAYKGALVFQTANNAVPAEQMRISSAGLVKLASYTTAGILVNDSSGNVTSSLGPVETVVAGGTCSTSYNVAPATGTMINLTLSGACAIGITGLAAGQSFTLKLTQSSTTTPTFSSEYKWQSAVAPSWSASATKYDLIACASLDGTTLSCSALIDVR